MKVREMIEFLKDEDPEAEVWIEHEDDDEIHYGVVLLKRDPDINLHNDDRHDVNIVVPSYGPRPWED